MVTIPIRFSKDSPREVDQCKKTGAHSLIIKISYQVNIGDIRYRTTSARKGQASIGHPFPIS